METQAACCSPRRLSLLLAEKYGLLLIMEQANGTRYENLRPVMIELIASKIVSMLADEENSPMMAQIMQSGGRDGNISSRTAFARARSVPD